MDERIELKKYIYVKCENPEFVLKRYEMQKSGSSMLAVQDIASSFNHCCCIHGDDQKFHKSCSNLLCQCNDNASHYWCWEAVQVIQCVYFLNGQHKSPLEVYEFIIARDNECQCSLGKKKEEEKNEGSNFSANKFIQRSVLPSRGVLVLSIGNIQIHLILANWAWNSALRNRCTGTQVALISGTQEHCSQFMWIDVELWLLLTS